jgi:outer membrane cobalamin receptor
MVGDRTKQALSLLLLAGAAIPGIALAQTQGSTAVSELMVTAQKRVEPLQKVPVSVTAVPGAQLEQLQALQLRDWAG